MCEQPHLASSGCLTPRPPRGCQIISSMASLMFHAWFFYFLFLRHSQSISSRSGLTQKTAKNEIGCVFPLCPLYRLKQCTGTCEAEVFCPVWSTGHHPFGSLTYTRLWRNFEVCFPEFYGSDLIFFEWFTALWAWLCLSPSSPSWVPLHRCGEGCYLEACATQHQWSLLKCFQKFQLSP